MSMKSTRWPPQDGGPTNGSCYLPCACLRHIGCSAVIPTSSPWDFAPPTADPAQLAVQPARKPADLQTDARHLDIELTDPVGDLVRLRDDGSFAHDGAVLVNDADRYFLQRHVHPTKCFMVMLLPEADSMNGFTDRRLAY